MDTTPDPQTVREIAREQILNHVRNLAQDDERVYESVIENDVCESLTDSEQQALTDDVLAAIERAAVTVSWPDEQPQDERDACRVQLPADSAQRLGASPDTTCARPDGHTTHDDGSGVLWADREHGAQDERDGDVRAVDAMLVAYVRDDADEIREAFDNLRNQFIGRIAELEVRDTQAALEARDAKAGAGAGE